jgi:large subunit ribosomal protein L29
MKVKNIRDLTTEEIIKKIKENKEELFNLRFQQATGNLEKPSRLKELRKEVARMKTIIREREITKE